MATWDEERRKIWGLLLELKQKVKLLEGKISERKEGQEQPPKAAGA